MGSSLKKGWQAVTTSNRISTGRSDNESSQNGRLQRKFVSPFYATLILTLSLPISLYAVQSSKISVLSSGVFARIQRQMSSVSVVSPRSHNPSINLWAWERDEDLSFVDPSKVSVSYFAGMIYVRGASVDFQPRKQKLKLAAGTRTVPVFRIETLRGEGAPGSMSTSDSRTPDLEAADYVAKTVVNSVKHLPASDMVQLDFDALQDERPFYVEILKKLREQLPAQTKISITALGSWLLGDKWLNNGDADEVVAMMFSIGADKKNILDRIQSQKLDSGTNAKMALGISANETNTNKLLFAADLQHQFDKLYIFNSRPWTRDRYQAITKEALKQ